MTNIRFYSSCFFLLSLLFFLTPKEVFPQIPVGSWRAHFPYSRAIKISIAGDKIYCAFNQGLFYFDQRDNSLGTLTKINGLSDVGISSLGFSSANNVLLVGYENGNIDLVFSNRIVNISDIRREHIIGSKAVNNILFIQNRAYLACGFGIVVIDLNRIQVADTYIIGQGGRALEIFDIETDGAFLYAATAMGVYYAALNSPNLADFANWNKINSLPNPNASYKFVKWFGNKLYVVEENVTGNENVYVRNGVTWQQFHVASGTIRSLGVSEGRLILVEQQRIKVFQQSGIQVLNIDDYGFSSPNPMDAIYTEDMVLWIADNFMGLLEQVGTSFRAISPNGPVSGNAFHLYASDTRVYLSGGGYDVARGNIFNNGEIFLFENDNWTSIINTDVSDVVRIIQHPDNPDEFFAASWGHGIIKYRDYLPVITFNPINSTLETIIPGNFCRIAGMVFDNEKNLWITNSNVPNPVSVKKNDGTWKSFPYSGVINHHTLGDIIYTQSLHHWLLLPRGGGLFAFDVNGTIDNTNDDRTRKFGLLDESGALITNEVFSLAEDKNGFIWVGTNDGVLVYFNPQNVFHNRDFYASRILVAGKTPGEGAYLLANEIVTAIFVDGGNRKWVGTQKAGVFLLSADGTKQLKHFTTRNSPLISDNITSIAVHPVTGEVFIATIAGLVSYRSDATHGKSSFNNVLVFPNPVRPDFDGVISIMGLMEETIVKITDINGFLVYETESVGGQATWDGKTAMGQRASTGVYLVFLSNKDGSETHITKLLFIH